MQSPNKSAIFVCLAVIVFFRYVESEATCDKLVGPLNNCHCRYSDGGDPPTYRDIDFSPLGRSDGKPAFGYKDGPNNTFKYAYNPCHPFTDEFCMKGTAACQVSDDEEQSHPIGDPDVVAFEVVDSDFVLTYAEVDRRLAVVHFHCDESALTTATYEPLGEREDGHYHFKVGTCLACLKDVPNCQSSSALTLGGILCIIFAVLVVVYLVAGTLFQKFVKGATGKEVIPNYEFWADLPYLIKDYAGETVVKLIMRPLNKWTNTTFIQSPGQQIFHATGRMRPWTYERSRRSMTQTLLRKGKHMEL